VTWSSIALAMGSGWIFAFKYRKVSLSSIIGTATILLLMWLPWTYGVMGYSLFNGYDSFILE
ncbi:hypothetical protein, partial [Stenotrophomonas maltophilia]|uniref:hypothetical protein n=1 Tax=Stenotrophomonas maltophilia TaxID=40324 RepID=UPI0019538C46